MNRASTPLVYDGAPRIEFQRLGQSPSSLNMKVVVYAYVALGVSRRPEGIGLIKGLTAAVPDRLGADVLGSGIHQVAVLFERPLKFCLSYAHPDLLVGLVGSPELKK